MNQAATLRSLAEGHAARLPALMADAENLAATVMLGSHGRRRSGMGDEFWQYRPAAPGDPARLIDWRRSARSDANFVQEKEWQAAQSVLIWSDDAQSMGFSSAPDLPSKAGRARVLALASAILLIRGGERVALADADARPRQGEIQLAHIADGLCSDGHQNEYGAPDISGALANSRVLFLSDFLGDIAPVTMQLTRAADQGVKGSLVHILDPQEEAFPFDGRTIFESMGRSVAHETLKASDLRQRYLDRLAKRKDELQTLAQRTGWQYHCHHTSVTAQSALLWIYTALERAH
ncbi:MAG: DUF58 domain-containing protein [Paracoccaceae bacterium]